MGYWILDAAPMDMGYWIMADCVISFLVAQNSRALQYLPVG